MPATGRIGSATPLSAATTRSARAAYVRRAERTTWSTYPSRSRETNARCTGHGAGVVGDLAAFEDRVGAGAGGATSQPSRMLGATVLLVVPR